MVLITAALALALSGPAQAQTQPPATGRLIRRSRKRTPKSRRPLRTPEFAPYSAISAKTSSICRRCRTSTSPRSAAALAAAAHPVDQSFNAKLLSHYDAVNTAFAPGKYLGNTPEQVAFSLGTYAFGRLRDQPKVAHLGMDLLQAQILTEILVEPLKFAVHRERPDGSNHQSFPSGHAAVTFATATVIERHLGWRKSVLGYAIASYVAMSRIHDNRHYLSDVIFGAAVGSIAGRTVVHHQADYWAFTPVAVPGGGVALMVSRTRWDQ